MSTTKIILDGLNSQEDGDDILPKPRPNRSWLNKIKSSFGINGDVSVRESLESALEEEEDSAASNFSPEERSMLINILQFKELRIDDVMVPRADIIAVDEQTSLAELLNVFRKAGHSRIPIYGETLDDLIGMVHIKDLMGWITSKALPKSRRRRSSATQSSQETQTNSIEFDLSKIDLSKTIMSIDIVRPILFVPPTMAAIDLLIKMQTSHLHLAMVIDEYGGTDGLVSIEDLVEEIVGEIEDEHDITQENLIVKISDDQYTADARVAVEEFNELAGDWLNLTEEEEENIDTLGGLVFSQLGRVPVRGEVVIYEDIIEFEVLEVSPRRIKKLAIRAIKRPFKVDDSS